MRLRHDVLESGYDMGTSGTVTVNVDYADPISFFTLYFEATNGATSNKSNPIERNISKIELVDGGEVLWSSPGDVALAYAQCLFGNEFDEYISGAISDSQWVQIPLVFGRELYDPQYAFNPVAFRNPQLKVTFDEATVRAAGATGFLSDSFTMSVIAHLMEETSPPLGYLSLNDVYEYTSLASGDTAIDMPTDAPWRSVMVRAYEAGQWPGTNITNVKLSCDGGKFIPFDLTFALLGNLHKGYFQPVRKRIYTVSNNAEAHEIWLANTVSEAIYSHNSSHIANASSPANGRITVAHYTHAGVAQNATPVHISVVGSHPHNLHVAPFGRLGVVEDWFNAPQYGSVKLFLTNGNAGAEVNVLCQQLKTY